MGPRSIGASPAAHELVEGVVASFDDATGLGEIDLESADTALPFHCTAIVDGTRRIDIGARVVATCRLGVLGRVEAHSVLRLA